MLAFEFAASVLLAGLGVFAAFSRPKKPRAPFANLDLDSDYEVNSHFAHRATWTPR